MVITKYNIIKGREKNSFVGKFQKAPINPYRNARLTLTFSLEKSYNTREGLSGGMAPFVDVEEEYSCVII